MSFSWKSSPPECVSPQKARTSRISPRISRIETSHVPARSRRPRALAIPVRPQIQMEIEEGSRRGFVGDTHHLQILQFPRSKGGPALRVIKIGQNRDAQVANGASPLLGPFLSQVLEVAPNARFQGSIAGRGE